MRGRDLAIVGAVLALAVAASALASSAPDGLDRVAADLGFSANEAVIYHAPLPSYAVAALPGGWSGAAAGVIGASVVGLCCWGLGRALVRRA